MTYTAHDGTPTQSGYGAGGGGSVYDPVLAALRLSAVLRLQQMNTRHVMHAWDRRRSDPLGPHAVAFLYADPQPGTTPQRYDVRAGTRLLLDDDDVRDLRGLLHGLVEVAHGQLSRGPGDIVATMVNRFDDDISSAATYYGVGVSTLDTPDGAWRDVQQVAAGPLDIPGRCYLLLGDGCRIRLDRPRQAYGSVTVESTHHIEVVPGMRWSWLREEPAGSFDDQLWGWLTNLHRAVVENYRRNGADPARRGRRTR